jgi:hypothetical protein
MRMCMTDADDGMASIHIKIFGALIIPNIRAACFYNINIIDGIYVE